MIISVIYLIGLLSEIDIRISELENYSNNIIYFSLGGRRILYKPTNIGIRFYSSKVKPPRVQGREADSGSQFSFSTRVEGYKNIICPSAMHLRQQQ